MIGSPATRQAPPQSASLFWSSPGGRITKRDGVGQDSFQFTPPPSPAPAAVRSAPPQHQPDRPGIRACVKPTRGQGSAHSTSQTSSPLSPATAYVQPSGQRDAVDNAHLKIVRDAAFPRWHIVALDGFAASEQQFAVRRSRQRSDGADACADVFEELLRSDGFGRVGEVEVTV